MDWINARNKGALIAPAAAAGLTAAIWHNRTTG